MNTVFRDPSQSFAIIRQYVAILPIYEAHLLLIGRYASLFYVIRG
jgi:hypothetical protein